MATDAPYWTNSSLSEIPSHNLTLSERNCTFLDLNTKNWIVSLITNPACYRHGIIVSCVLCVSFTLVFFSGLVWNSLVIWAIRRPGMKSVTNTFILNLAVADLLVIFFCVLPTLLSNVFVPWVLGKFLCKLLPYIQGVSVYSSVYSLVAVSIDRAKVINGPLRLHQGFSKSTTIFTITLIWLTAIVITLPSWIVFDVVHQPFPNLQPFCIEHWDTKVHEQLFYAIHHIGICYIGPVVGIIMCNLTIWKKVSNRKLPENPACTENIATLHLKTKLRVQKMLVRLTLAFFICWLPLHLVMTWHKFFGFPTHSLTVQIYKVCIPFAQIMGICNSCINPVLYALYNKRNPETFKSLFTSCTIFKCPSSQRNNRSPGSNIHETPVGTDTHCNTVVLLHHRNQSNVPFEEPMLPRTFACTQL